eukprot:3891965-Amphidinium_carterae.1
MPQSATAVQLCPGMAACWQMDVWTAELWQEPLMVSSSAPSGPPPVPFLPVTNLRPPCNLRVSVASDTVMQSHEVFNTDAIEHATIPSKPGSSAFTPSIMT